MNKKTKFLIYSLIFSLLANCSFDNRSGIWSGSEEEKKIAKIEIEQQKEKKVVKVYAFRTPYSKEISITQNIIYFIVFYKIPNNFVMLFQIKFQTILDFLTCSS